MKNRNYEIRRYDVLNGIASEGNTVIFGSDEELMLPINELTEYYGTKEVILSRSFIGLTVMEAADLYRQCVSALKPGKLLIRVGNDDSELFASDREGFDRAYMELITTVRSSNSGCEIALLSVGDESMNEHIRGIASSCGCEYCDVTAARLSEVKTILDVYNTGFLRPLHKGMSVSLITRMLYSVMNESPVEAEATRKAKAPYSFMRFLKFANH